MYQNLSKYYEGELEELNTGQIKREKGQARWLTSVIPALWEAEMDGSRGQEVETILVNMVKPRLLLKIQKLAGHGGACL